MAFDDRDTPEWIALAQEERRAAVARFNARREIEWKVAFALWAAFGLIANAVRLIELDEVNWKIVTTVLVLAVVAMHARWVQRFVEKAADPNWQEGKDLTDIIRKRLDIGDDEVEPAGSGASRFGYWWQVGMTGLLAAFFLLIVWL